MNFPPVQWCCSGSSGTGGRSRKQPPRPPVPDQGACASRREHKRNMTKYQMEINKDTYPITARIACLGGATRTAWRTFFAAVLPRTSGAFAAPFGAGFDTVASFPCGWHATSGSWDEPASAIFFSRLGGSMLSSPPLIGAAPPTSIRNSSSSSDQYRKRSGCGDLPTRHITPASAPASCVPAGRMLSAKDSSPSKPACSATSTDVLVMSHICWMVSSNTSFVASGRRRRSDIAKYGDQGLTAGAGFCRAPSRSANERPSRPWRCC